MQRFNYLKYLAVFVFYLAIIFPVSAQNLADKDEDEKTIHNVSKDEYTKQPVPEKNICRKIEPAKLECEKDFLQKFTEDITWFIPEKKEAKWLKWGFEWRFRQEFMENFMMLDANLPNWNYFRFRTRLWAEITPTEYLSAYVRLANRFRAWMQPEVVEDFNQIFFDNIYYTLKRPFNLPFTVKMGRQDMFYGKGFIIADGTPADGSRSVFFDAIKATLHIDDLKTDIDALVIETEREDRKFFQFNPTKCTLVEQQIRSYGYYLTSKYFDNVVFEQYYLYTDFNGQRIDRADYIDLNTVGGRVSVKPIENFTLESELNVQYGNHGDEKREGLGGYVEGTYRFPVKFKPSLNLHYYYLSGDNPDTDKREDWDPLFGRWPLHSELVLFMYAREEGIARWSNMHKLGLSTVICPLPSTTLTFGYDKLWADHPTYAQRPGFADGSSRGDLLRAIAKFNLSKNISVLTHFEYFDPGNYYIGTADEALFFRWEFKFVY